MPTMGNTCAPVSQEREDLASTAAYSEYMQYREWQAKAISNR